MFIPFFIVFISSFFVFLLLSLHYYMNAKQFFSNSYIQNFLLACIVIILLIFLSLWWLGKYTHHGESTEIPDVKGFTIEKAEPFFKTNHLNYQVIDSVFNRNAAPGTIVETIPPIGTKVKEGRTIYVTLNSFSSQLLAVPDVTDYSQRQAIAILKSIGFENIQTELVPGAYRDLVLGLKSNEVPLEAGKLIPIHTQLTLLVSSGEEEEELFPEDSVIIESGPEESWF